jgi:adenylate cyclase
MERKLAAIFSADVKGYSRLMGDDEIATVRTLTAYREVMTNMIQAHRDPNDAESHAWLGQIFNYSGRPEETVGLMEKAMRLNPHYPEYYPSILGFSYRLLGHYQEAIAAQKSALSRNPDFLSGHTVLAVLYSELGREEEARAEVAEMLRISPQFSLKVYGQRIPFKNPADLERYLAALRKAGLK